MTWSTLLGSAGLPSDDRLWPILQRTKLAPLVYLSRLGVEGRVPPSSWRRQYRSDYLQSLVSHHHYMSATTGILNSVSAAGIPAMILRGPRVAELLYDDPGLRPYTDIDMLVPRAQLPDAKAVAMELGFQPPRHGFQDGFYERNHLHLRYTHVASGIPLEIHWSLDHPFSLHRIDYQALFRSAAAVPLGDAMTLSPAPEDDLLLLAVHLAKHAGAMAGLPGERLPAFCLERGLVLWMIDLDRLVRDRPGLDWDAVVRRAQAWEITGPVGCTLSALSTVLDTPIPEAPLRDLRKAGRPGLLERGTARLARGSGPLSRGFRHLSSRLSRSPAYFGLDRLSGLADYLLPPAAWSRRHAPLKRLPLALRRLAHLFGSMGRLARFAWDLAAQSTRMLTSRPGRRSRVAVAETGRSPART